MPPTPEAPLDRRPMFARDLGLMKAGASWLARHKASPNAISVAGAISSILAGAALYSTSRHPATARMAWIGAVLLILGRALANLWDGMVAVERGIASKVGELYNEVPDRVSDTAILVGLGYAAGGHVIWGY